VLGRGFLELRASLKKDKLLIATEENYQAYTGLKGALLGTVPSQWPAWFAPRQVRPTR
jgi:hypothetical protein